MGEFQCGKFILIMGLVYGIFLFVVEEEDKGRRFKQEEVDDNKRKNLDSNLESNFFEIEEKYLEVMFLISKIEFIE